jgi:hypothetical protein
MALYLRARQPGLASTPSQLVESFQWQLEFARIAKFALDAMVYVPDAQGSLGQAAEPSQTTYWLACLWESSVDKGVSHDADSLVSHAPELLLDESVRP